MQSLRKDLFETDEVSNLQKPPEPTPCCKVLIPSFLSQPTQPNETTNPIQSLLPTPRVSIKISVPPVESPEESFQLIRPEITQMETPESNLYSREEIIRKWENIENKFKEENARIDDLKERGKNFDYNEFKKIMEEKSFHFPRKNFIITSDERGSWRYDLDTVNQYTQDRLQNFFRIIFRVKHLEIQLEKF